MSLNGWFWNSDDEDFGYKELQGSLKANFGADNSQATRQFIINWEQQARFMDDLLGWSSRNPDLTISRVLPDQHPSFPTFYALEASTEPCGAIEPNDIGAVGKYEKVKVTAVYKPVDFAVLADSQIVITPGAAPYELDRYCTRTLQYATEVLTLNGFLKWVSRPNHDPLGANPGKVIGTIEKTIVWHQIPSFSGQPYDIPNVAVIQSLAGTVNSTAFDGNARGTVLFLGSMPHLVKPRLAQEGHMWDMEYKFLVKNNSNDTVPFFGEPAGHNFLFDPVNSRWDLVTADGTIAGQTLYDYADLNDLFVLT